MKHLLLLLMLVGNMSAYAQTADTAVLAANIQADASVVEENIPLMKAIYADDFVFTHAESGRVDSKTSYINIVQNPEVRYLSPKQDFTKIEMHGHVTIVTGKLEVVSERKQKISNYHLWYLRAFVLKDNRWQIVSQRSIKEALRLTNLIILTK